MLDNERGGCTLPDSTEFNAALWAARGAGDEQLAESMLRQATWVSTEHGTLTRRVELDQDQTAEVLELLRGVASGKIAVHESYLPAVQQMLEQDGLQVS